MAETYLNDVDGFAKACLCGESFWIKDVEQESSGVMHGVVDNNLLFTNEHGLKLGNKVSFREHQ